MKIPCPCGASIVDNTDFLSYKAHRIADRDWEDLLDDDGAEPGWRRASRLSRSMWQCLRCGRLCLDDRNGRLHWFVPEAPGAVRHRLLSSVHGARWKGHLRGHWQSDPVHGRPGELWWSCGDDDSGWEEFTSRAELERRYDEEFTRLNGSDLLRSAFLRVDGHTTHDWPRQDAPGGG